MGAQDNTVEGGYLFNAQTLGASVNSTICNISRSTCIGLDLFLDNTNAVGTIAVQVCNDLTPSSPNWVAVEFSDGTTSIAVASGTDTTKFIDLADLGAKYLRVAYTFTSGAGTLTTRAHVKHNVGV